MLSAGHRQGSDEGAHTVLRELTSNRSTNKHHSQTAAGMRVRNVNVTDLNVVFLVSLTLLHTSFCSKLVPNPNNSNSDVTFFFVAK
jgi:hypothetical protein